MGLRRSFNLKKVVGLFLGIICCGLSWKDEAQGSCHWRREFLVANRLIFGKGLVLVKGEDQRAACPRCNWFY